MMLRPFIESTLLIYFSCKSKSFFRFAFPVTHFNLHIMKHITFLIILSLCLSQSHAQSFTYATRAGFIGNDYSNNMVTDASGNVFITGKFRDSIKFGSLTTLISTGYDDVFIVK